MATVRYDGVCPICGSRDGMIIQSGDGKYRNLCRVMGCPAMYLPAPLVGFDKIEDCQNPFDSELITNGITIGEYIGKKE